MPWLGRGYPRRTAGNDGQASSVTRRWLWKASRDQRSPLRRCFKPRPLLRAECAGFASGCRSDVLRELVSLREERLTFLRRLAGLLSGYLPIDTRPQARAKLGNHEITFFSRCASELVRPTQK